MAYALEFSVHHAMNIITNTVALSEQISVNANPTSMPTGGDTSGSQVVNVSARNSALRRQRSDRTTLPWSCKTYSLPAGVVGFQARERL